MFKSNILKFAPLLFLKRRALILPRTVGRKLTITPSLLKENKKQNAPKSEKKTESKKNTFQAAKKKVYYKFLCKCEAGFNSFSEFLNHLKVSHQIKNLNFAEIFAKKDGSKWEIKFYWHLACQCGHKFSSSLCNADLKVSEGQIEIARKYRLQCLKCKKHAKFDNEELLNEFLKDRVKQKLIYRFYKEKFAKFKSETHSERVLESHIQSLCEKCKLLGRYCGEELIQQEQVSQIGYVSPFTRR